MLGVTDMPRQFPVREEISGLVGPEGPGIVGACSIGGTQFHNNSTKMPRSPERRLTIRDVSVNRCEHFACIARGVAFEDVKVTDIRGGGRALSFLWGCLYSRVALRGHIGGILVRWRVDPRDEEFSRTFLQANLSAYQHVDWALDISEAQFSYFLDFLGIPSGLVRRNPDRHFVMTRGAANTLLASDTEPDVWRISAELLIESGLEDTVIACGGAGKRLQRDLDAAKELRDQGLLQ